MSYWLVCIYMLGFFFQSNAKVSDVSSRAARPALLPYIVGPGTCDLLL